MPRAVLLFLVVSSVAFAQTAPEAPVITEPPFDDTIVNPADVHMETAPMVDADGDDHACSDFEIWTITPSERVWVTACIGGVERVHTHLGDGVFENSHADLSELLYDTAYVLRVRFRDSSGDWSAWAERSFRTGDPSVVYPLSITDVDDAVPVTMRDLTGVDHVLAEGAAVRVDAADGAAFLRIVGAAGANTVEAFAERADHADVRIVMEGGPHGASLPELDVAFTDDDGRTRVLYLPGAALGANLERVFWASENGSTFEGSLADTDPDFSELARGNPVPWVPREEGFRAEVVARGFQLPVNVAFRPAPGDLDDDPAFYVSELYGTIKTVLNDGTVIDYATGLLNFNPTGNFPGSGEQGVGGLVVDPATGDLFVGHLYDAAPPNGPHYPKVVRMTSFDGGRTVGQIDTILEMPGETQGQSHFISNLSIGPDGKLYVHMGDGFNAGTALDLDSFRGKILRMEFDGTPCTDNPYYDAGDGIGARDYVWVHGYRNPFGGAWRTVDGAHYTVENGPGSNDRLSRALGGESFGWDGSASSMTTLATYLWNPTHAPVNIDFVESGKFDGSGFPARFHDRAFVTESGPTWATGAQARGKRIVWFDLDAQGQVVGGPHDLVEYDGVGKATAVGLTAGPDGLYFTDLYKDMDYATPIDVGAQVLRVKWVGKADFEISDGMGAPPFAVKFTDRSEVPGPRAYRWSFGDGATSSTASPTHVYTTPGIYDVRLEVIGGEGLVVEQKNGAVYVGDAIDGLIAEIYDTIDLSGPALTRIDPNVDFQWGSGSPDPSIGANTFSVRWTGQIDIPSDDTWTFTLRIDDGARLWIDDQLVIDAWQDQAPTEHAAAVALAPGLHDLRLEYYENGGGAVCQLSWASSTVAQEIVPPSAFRIEVESPAPTAAPRPRDFVVHGARPNPFNPATRIEFELPRAGRVDVRIYDTRGRLVAHPAVDRGFAAGPGAVTFDGRDPRGSLLASGVYLARVRFVDAVSGRAHEMTRRMTLVK